MTTTAPKTVPCKYKTGKVLGQGSYAVVRGNFIYFPFNKYIYI